MHPLLLFTLLFIPGILSTSSPSLDKRIMVDYHLYPHSHLHDIYSKRHNIDDWNILATPQMNDNDANLHVFYKPNSDNKKTDVQGNFEFYTSSVDSDSGKLKPNGYVRHSFKINGGDPNVVTESDLSFSGKTDQMPNKNLKNVNGKFLEPKLNLNKPKTTDFCPCCKKHSPHFSKVLNQKDEFCPCCKCSTKKSNNNDQTKAGSYFKNGNENYQKINDDTLLKNPLKMNKYDDENIETSIQSPLDLLNPFKFDNYLKDISFSAKNEGRKVRNEADKKLKALSQSSEDEPEFGKLQEIDLMADAEKSLDALSETSVKKDKIFDLDLDEEFNDLSISNNNEVHSNELNNFQQPITPKRKAALPSERTKKFKSDSDELQPFDESSSRVENVNRKKDNKVSLNYNPQLQNIEKLINELENNEIFDEPLTKDKTYPPHVTFKSNEHNNAQNTFKLSTKAPGINKNKVSNIFNENSNFHQSESVKPDDLPSKKLKSSSDEKPFDSIFENVDNIFDKFELKESLENTQNKKDSTTESPLKPKSVKILVTYPPPITTKGYIQSTQSPQSDKIQNVVTAKTQHSDDEDPHLKELTFWNRFKNILSPFL